MPPTINKCLRSIFMDFLQFDFTDNADSGTHVNSSSNIVLHGANLGLEAKW